MQDSYKYSDLTHKIIGCAMEVHKTLGSGFQEVIYQRSLALELESSGINFTREVEIPMFYKGKQVGTRRVDFFVDGKVIIEIKALTKLEDVHFAQSINYLEASNLEIGLLLNFGSRSLEFKRLLNRKSK